MLQMLDLLCKLKNNVAGLKVCGYIPHGNERGTCARDNFAKLRLGFNL